MRATDSVSGVFAEVPVSIVVSDVNDSPPTLPQDNYDITVPESAPFGSAILKVAAQDNDIGKMQMIADVNIKKKLVILIYFHFHFICTLIFVSFHINVIIIIIIIMKYIIFAVCVYIFMYAAKINLACCK